MGRGARDRGRGSRRTMPRHRAALRVLFCIALILAPRPAPHAPALAAELPSLFRGVVVANSPLGVRVVSVEESSQASLADLRPEDIIVRIGERELHSIDEFAALSSALKGTATSATMLIFRNGAPREVALHLYSYPVLREWRVEFLPAHDVRFAQPGVGQEYWRRLGRGFEQAGKPGEALNAYLNALHNVPKDGQTAQQASVLFLRVSEARLREGGLTEGIGSLRQAVTMMDRLFNYPLTEEQLTAIRQQLQQTLQALRDAPRTPQPKT